MTIHTDDCIVIPRFDQSKAQGFIAIFGLLSKIAAKRDLQASPDFQ
ncbi:hypothetical protein ABT115_08510 [Streptomyces sp. NPDC001832]